MGQILFSRTQLAVQTPFQPNRNPQYAGNPGPSGLVSTEAQSAIEEAKATALGTASRYITCFTYQGGANNHWLEFAGTNKASNTNPLVIGEPSTLRAISVSVQQDKNTRATFSIYKNGSLVTTFSMVDAVKAYVSGLNFDFSPLDDVSVFAVQDSGADNPLTGPSLNLFFRVNTA